MFKTLFTIDGKKTSLKKGDIIYLKCIEKYCLLIINRGEIESLYIDKSFKREIILKDISEKQVYEVISKLLNIKFSFKHNENGKIMEIKIIEIYY